MKWLCMAALAACSAALGPSAFAQSTGDVGQEDDGDAATARGAGPEYEPQLDATDRWFLTQAYEDNELQVKLGMLAADEASSELVRDFGRRMVGDHELALTELERIARREGVSLPLQLGPARQARYRRLSSLEGPALDQAYMQRVVPEHEQAIKAFRHEVRYGSDPALQAYAERQLPMLCAHERIAEVIQRQAPDLVQGTTPSPSWQGGPPAQR